MLSPTTGVEVTGIRVHIPEMNSVANSERFAAAFPVRGNDLPTSRATFAVWFDMRGNEHRLRRNLSEFRFTPNLSPRVEVRAVVRVAILEIDDRADLDNVSIGRRGK